MTKKEYLYAIGMFFLAALFLVYEMAIQVSPSVMTNQLMEEFQIGTCALGWMASVYFYSYTLMQIPVGLLYDRFGPRKLLTIASFLCAFGILIFSQASSLYMAAIGRFLMGIGSSFSWIGVLVVISRWFSKELFPLFVGFAQFIICVGAIAGEVPLALAVESYGWRTLMWCLMMFGFVLGIIYILFLKNHPNHEFDEPSSSQSYVLSNIKKVMGNSQSWYCGLYAFCSWGPIIMFASLWGVPYLSFRFEISSYYASLATMMMWLGCGLSSPFINLLSAKIQRRKPILTYGALLGLVSFSSILYMDHLTLPAVLVLLFFCGVAVSCHIITFLLVKDNNSPEITGTSIGFNTMAAVLGGAILQPIGGFLINSTWDGAYLSSGVPLYTIFNFQQALLVIPALFFLGLIISVFFIKESYCKSSYLNLDLIKLPS